ncbi:MAG: ATP-grasp domain-containing protein [Sedimentisphaerales bacterium]|nr:ATP-grasp domain-containing protein [Sedimentisphaerales bacterium]
MILLDKPYISDFLLNTIESNHLEVVDTPVARSLAQGRGLCYIAEQQAAARLNAQTDPLIYTASENALSWVADKLAGSNAARVAELVKNKARFRELIQPMYQDFYFREIPVEKIASLNASELRFPLVIKPAVGFFSLGVYVVDSAGNWPAVQQKLLAEVDKISGLYPAAVVNTSSYLAEEVITGREFALDAYFDKNGQPVILNIMEHFFDGPDDVSDRVYITSRAIINEFMPVFTDFLGSVNALLQARNFVVHVEARINSSGVVVPIEINPMRFGGWCTTADLTWYAYQENSYLNYLWQNKPNWQRILNGKDDSVYALVVLDNSTGVEGAKVASFDYDRLLACFSQPLELRKTNWKEYPLFGYFFTRTPKEGIAELNDILTNDLREFCSFAS